MKPRFSRFLPVVTVLGLSSVAMGANLYWSATTSDGWNTAANWSTDANSYIVSAAIPGAGDNVFFNLAALSTDQLILLNGTRSANSLNFSSTGTTSIQGGTTSRTLNIGPGGILINGGAGAVSFGSTTTGFGVSMRFADSQTWTNNSSSLFTVTNSIQSTATSGTQTLTIDGTGNTTLSGVISNGSTGGIVGLTKTGSGTLSVASNSYTGVTTLAGGIFQIRNFGVGGASSSIGSSTADSANLVFDGGTFEWLVAAATMTDRGFTLNAGGGTILNDNTGSLVRFAGAITGSGDLTKTGAGTLALSGTSDYTGKTLINGGIISARAGGTLGAGGSFASGTEVAAGAKLELDPSTTGGSGVNTTWTEYLTLNGGTLDNRSRNNTWEGAVTLAANSIISTNASTSLDVTGVVDGVGRLTKTGAGTLYLTQSNTYNGATYINEGVLRVSTLANGGGASGIGASSSASSNLVFNGGTLWLSSGGNVGVNRGFTLDAGGGTIRRDSDILRFSGVVTGAGDLRKIGSGTLALSAANIYTGQTIIDAGTVAARSAGALGAFGTAANGTVINAGGTLSLDPGGSEGANANSVWNETAILRGGTLRNQSFNNTWQGALTLEANSNLSADTGTTLRITSSVTESGGSYGLTKIGAGTVRFEGTHSYTGATGVTGGVLAAAATGGFNSSTSLNVAGGTFRWEANDVFNDAAAVTLGAGAVLQFNDFSEILGALTVSDSALLDLNGDSGIVHFSKSEAPWSGILSITGWDGLVAGGGDEQVIFGNDGTGLGSQVGNVQFVDPTGLAPGTYGADILSTGEIVPGQLIPEPSALLLAMFGGAGLVLRRKR